MAGNSVFAQNVPGNDYALDNKYLRYDNNKKEYVQGGQDPPKLNSSLSYQQGPLDVNKNLGKESGDLQKFLKIYTSERSVGPAKLKNLLHSYFSRRDTPSIDDTDEHSFGMQEKKKVLTEAISTLLLTQHYFECFEFHISVLKSKKQIGQQAQVSIAAGGLNPSPGGRVYGLERITENDVLEVVSKIENTFAGTTGATDNPILTTLMDNAFHILWLSILTAHATFLQTVLNFDQIKQYTVVVDAMCGGDGTGVQYLDNLDGATQARVVTEVNQRVLAFDTYLTDTITEESLRPYSNGGGALPANVWPYYNLVNIGGIISCICCGAQGRAGPLEADYVGLHQQFLWVPGHVLTQRQRDDLQSVILPAVLKPVLAFIRSGNFATTSAISSIISTHAENPGTATPVYTVALKTLDIPKLSNLLAGFNTTYESYLIPENITGRLRLSTHLGFNKFINMVVKSGTTTATNVLTSLGHFVPSNQLRTIDVSSRDNTGVITAVGEIESMIGGTKSNNLFGGSTNSDFANWIRTSGPNVLLCAQFLWNADVRGDIMSDGRFKFKPFSAWEDAKGKPYGNYFILLVKFYYNYVSKNTQIYKNGTMYHDLIGTVYADTALVPTRGQVIGSSRSMNVLGGLDIQIPQVFSFLQGTLPFMQTVAVILNQNNVRLNNSSSSSAPSQPTYSGTRAPPVLRGGSNDNYKIIVASVLGKDFTEYSNMIGGAAVLVDVEPSKFNGKHLVEKLRKEARLRIDQLKIKGINAKSNQVRQVEMTLDELEEKLKDFEDVLIALKAAVVDKSIDQNKVFDIKQYTEDYMTKANDIKNQYRDAVVLVGNIGGFP